MVVCEFSKLNVMQVENLSVAKVFQLYTFYMKNANVLEIIKNELKMKGGVDMWKYSR